MIVANLYQLVAASAEVLALLGDPPRFYPFGSAPQSMAALPYATQRTIDQVPANNLTNPPPCDIARVQVSCWSARSGNDGVAQVEAVAMAMRRAIEPRWHILTVRDGGRDPETMRFRIDLDVQVFIDHLARAGTSS